MMTVYCKVCNAKFSCKPNMLRHIKEVHGIVKSSVHRVEKPLKCSECDYQCFDSTPMNRHINAVHKNYRGEYSSEC